MLHGLFQAFVFHCVPGILIPRTRVAIPPQTGQKVRQALWEFDQLKLTYMPGQTFILHRVEWLAAGQHRAKFIPLPLFR